MQKIGVVLPAGGKGSRLGGTRKQFRLLGGKPVVFRTVEVFDRHALIDELVIVVPAAFVKETQLQVQGWRLETDVKVVAGGSTRQNSVCNGISALSDEIQLVLVHDAVRPFVTHSQIEDVILAVRKSGGAALAIPLTDTLRRGADGVLEETIPREGLFRMQTPQGFLREWLVDAHRYADENKVQATDEVALVGMIGKKTKIVAGRPDNIKITTSEDWLLAQQYWSLRSS